MRLCAVESCERKHEARGLCHGHLAYLYRTGEWPTHRLYSDIPFEERFWARTTPGDNGCILWTGSTGGDGRYGTCVYQGRNRPAHVVAFLAFRGEYDQSLDLDHLCRTTLCVNPWHLEPVTHAENILRGLCPTAVNARKTHCIRGHEFTPENTHYMRRGGRSCRACARGRHAEVARRRHDNGECAGGRRCRYCEIPSCSLCDLPAIARGLCKRHYNAAYRLARLEAA